MKDYLEIDDAIKLKMIWPAILEHGSLQIQEVVDPHKNLLERVFNGCWLETKYLPESANESPVTARYSLENGKTMKVLSSDPDKKLEADFGCYVFFAELVLRERYRRHMNFPADEYVRGPELDKIMNKLN